MGNTAYVPGKAARGQTPEGYGYQQPPRTTTEQASPEPSWDSWFSDPLIFATLWLAVATTALFYFTYRLWSATKTLAADAKTSGADQAEKMERSIREAAKAAVAMEKLAQASEAQFKLAQEANEIARNTARHELRAYVGLSEPSIEPYEWGNEKTGKVVIVLRNVGHTPAFQSVTKISMAVAPYDSKSPVIPKSWDRESERKPFDIQPGADLLRETRLPIDAILARWEEMESGTDAIFVRVEISFSTIYEERFRQVTVFHSHGRRYREALPMNVTRQFAEEKVEYQEA